MGAVGSFVPSTNIHNTHFQIPPPKTLSYTMKERLPSSPNIMREKMSSQAKWEQTIASRYEEYVADVLHKNVKQMKLHSSQIQELQKNILAGSPGRKKAVRDIAKKEGQIAKLIEKNIVIRSHKNQMKGEFVDTYLRDTEMNFRYVDLMIARFRHTTTSKGQTRQTSMQNRFQKDVFKHYDGIALAHEHWCPIAQRWYGMYKVARLVPYNIGGANCDYLFGKPDTTQGHLMSPSNGLALKHYFADALDDGAIVIVPASRGDVDPETNEKVDFEHDEEPYKIRVLTPSWPCRYDFNLSDESNPDGRILKFRNEHRPMKRYLWFRAIINIARRRQ